MDLALWRAKEIGSPDFDGGVTAVKEETRSSYVNDRCIAPGLLTDVPRVSPGRSGSNNVVEKSHSRRVDR